MSLFIQDPYGTPRHLGDKRSQLMRALQEAAILMTLNKVFYCRCIQIYGLLFKGMKCSDYYYCFNSYLFNKIIISPRILQLTPEKNI